MYCRHCGQNINEKAEYCVHCGCKPLSGLKYCQECGVETTENQELCIKCGVKLLKQNSNNKNSEGINDKINNLLNGNKPIEENLDFSYLAPYWQNEFKRIHESKETYNGKWNWCAFFFSWIWAFTKGLWILAIASLVLDFITYGVLWIVLSVYFGIRGNKLYYNLIVKKQQTLF